MSTNATFAKEFTATLVRLGISQREVAKRTRISAGDISNMCLGHVPTLAQILQLTRILSLDPTALLTAAGYPRAKHHSALDTSTDQPPYAVPFLGEVPGKKRMRRRKSEQHVAIPAAYHTRTDFCLRAAGDTMAPCITAGDLLGIHAQTTARPGQLAVIEYHGERLLCTQQIDDLHFIPLAAQSSPIPLDDPQVIILGIVIWQLREWVKD